jgi:hypothetical protein
LLESLPVDYMHTPLPNLGRKYAKILLSAYFTYPYNLDPNASLKYGPRCSLKIKQHEFPRWIYRGVDVVKWGVTLAAPMH